MSRFAAAATAIAIAAATIGGTAAMGQLAAQPLAERPLAGALRHPSIAYYTKPTHDPVTGLDARIADGTLRLEFEEGSGYLRPILTALHLPVESQLLVMSKTGIQGLYSGPANPRAIYFNDAATVGYIRGAPFLEFAVDDPEQGVIFYTLDQKPQARPMFERRPACLSCHQAYATLHVPGMLARSVFMAPDGLPLSQFGSYDADDRTPFRRRWGGWYVTGVDGDLRHIGNAFVTDTEKREAVVSDSTLHRMPMEKPFDPHGYPSSSSDIAALMVFQHQGRMTNLITRVGWEARMAADGGRIDFAGGSLHDAVNELVDYLFFIDAEALPAPIKGTSGFAEIFSGQGPRDHRGRSLRQLDLEHRLLKYPCSYMIYSAAFLSLPDDVRAAIYARMWSVLSGKDTSPRYSRLSPEDRRAVIEILRDTLPDITGAFTSGRAEYQGEVRQQLR
jgi:hypothetical protein